MSYVLVGCRLLIGLVFVLSAVSKIRSRAAYAKFREATRSLAPGLPYRPVAAFVVALELAVAPALAWPTTTPIGFAAAAALLAAFTVATASAIRRGSRVDCRCFGPSATTAGAGHLVRNGVLLAAATAGAGLAVAGVPPVGAHLAGVAVAVAAALLLTTLAVLADDIAGLFSASP
ncbi:MauE/DoxX family redox-associated membrane protein [Microbispora sp. CA-135349]|uniref:MauE/DoxX family redox-associated membrane protein n=1 Tax=Microbispora sp. CA-135349 TaxID=3239953 RepID=UPI003D8C3905